MDGERIETVVNIIVGLAAAYVQFDYYWTTRQKNSWRWIKLAFAGVCALWALTYFFVEIGWPTRDLHFIRSWMIRPLVTVTLGAILASGIMRRKTKT